METPTLNVESQPSNVQPDLATENSRTRRVSQRSTPFFHRENSRIPLAMLAARVDHFSIALSPTDFRIRTKKLQEKNSWNPPTVGCYDATDIFLTKSRFNLNWGDKSTTVELLDYHFIRTYITSSYIIYHFLYPFDPMFVVCLHLPVSQ